MSYFFNINYIWFICSTFDFICSCFYFLIFASGMVPIYFILCFIFLIVILLFIIYFKMSSSTAK